jgi:hypothetical protein
VPVQDLAGQGVTRLADVQLPGHGTPIRFVDRVDHGQQVQGLGDPAVLGQGLAEWGGMPVAGQHPQQVVGADLVGDQGADHPQHVRPVGHDPVEVDLVAGDRVQRPVVAGGLAGHVGAPEPGAAHIGDARREPVPQQPK